MTTLATNSTDGTFSFTKYVTNNKRYEEIEYLVENGTTAFVYRMQSGKLLQGNRKYGAGTKLRIIDPNYHVLGGVKFAKVKVGSELGFMQLNRIRKPTSKGNGTQYEDKAIDSINSFILAAGGVIDLKLKGDSTLYKGISYAVKVDSSIRSTSSVRGDPKTDFILCRDRRHPVDPSSIYVSHKKAGGAEAFQQYGGVSPESGMRIHNNPIVQEFLERCASLIGDSSSGLPNPVMGTYSDKQLSNLAIFGPGYGSKFSVDNCTVLGQGHPVMTDRGAYVELMFSSHTALSGQLGFFSGQYQPVLGATFRQGRSFVYKGKRYFGARLGIYPKKLIEVRKNLIEVKL